MSSNSSTLKRLVPFIAGGVLVAVISFVTVLAVNSGSDSTLANTAPAASRTEPRLGSKENPHQVSLTGTQTEPIDLLVDVGDYVQFNSRDGREHQVIQGKPTADHGHDEYADAVHGEAHGLADSPLDSGIIKADEGYLVQFTTVGKFDFHDNYNHDYAITVISYDKDKSVEDTRIE